MYIYKIECNITGDVYYGSTKRLSQRKCQHRHSNSGLKVSSNKITDRGNYTFKIIEECKEEERREREQYYISNFDCVNIRNAKRLITKKEYNRIDTNRRNKWVRSFGDPRYNNCLAKIDISIFD